jgi:hypothetical protein
MLKMVLRAKIEDDYQIDAVMSSKATLGKRTTCLG